MAREPKILITGDSTSAVNAARRDLRTAFEDFAILEADGDYAGL